MFPEDLGVIFPVPTTFQFGSQRIAFSCSGTTPSTKIGSELSFPA